MKKDNDTAPRKFEHYSVTLHKESIPNGVELWIWNDTTGGLKKEHPNG
jgi:hypothetical protein